MHDLVRYQGMANTCFRSFACPRDKRGHGLFPVASRFNHACSTVCSVHYCYDSRQGALVFTIANNQVQQGQELTISYGKDPDMLKTKYGFDCRCGGCAHAYRAFLIREYGLPRW